MDPIPCNHCRQPTCRLCFLYRTRADYRALWSPPAPGAKPRVSVAELAEKRKRCKQAKAAGLPCTEFAPPQPATPAPPAPTPD